MQPLPLPLAALGFYFSPPGDWPGEPVAVAFRLRGTLGKIIRQRHCLFDAARTPCEGCEMRSGCFYGNGFETMPGVEIPGFGRLGAAPHGWSLHVDRAGHQWRAALWLLAGEIERAEVWRDAIAALPLAPAWAEPPALESETLRWRSLTPVRLRLRGRNPTREEAAEALAASVARKARMLAALHGADAPDSRLEIEDARVLGWVDVERFAFRHRRVERLGGWMLEAAWSERGGEDWRPWLTLIRALGAGRQTAFGLGRFGCLDGPAAD